MADLHPEARELLESDRLAHMVTLNPDGSPQVTCVWVGLDGDEICSAHLGRYQKVKNVERDSRVAISIETDEPADNGLFKYLVVRGTARIQEGGAPELLQRGQRPLKAPIPVVDDRRGPRHHQLGYGAQKGVVDPVQ